MNREKKNNVEFSVTVRKPTDKLNQIKKLFKQKPVHIESNTMSIVSNLHVFSSALH